MTIEHVDVLIIGAGLSGIGAACHLQARCPSKRYVILEGREQSGGTWDLFRYPGIRSDSDMHTLGYSFRPWMAERSIADGETILQYVRDTARDYGIERNIRYGQRAISASWSSEDATWTVTIQRRDAPEPLRMRCSFLFCCCGYYNYEHGYTPQFAGSARFSGRIVHPQHWTSDIDYAGKRVVVIGSGATAITLVPELAKSAAHVTMLQRSPSYVVALPAIDAFTQRLSAMLPGAMAQKLTRLKNVLVGLLFFQLSRRAPLLVKRALLHDVREALGPDFDVDRHFTPTYNPWDQRICVVPDGDLFEAIRSGRASVVTDHIETFTERGIALRSGAELEADLIVTATGLNLEVLGGLALTVDDRPIEMSRQFTYKGMMYNDVPNLASSFGYTNASWTLKCDLTCAYVCRLLNHLDQIGMRQCTPRLTAPIDPQPWLDFSSGYVQRSIDKYPRQGSKRPWRVHQNYLLDLMGFKFSKVEDGTMEFSNPVPVTNRKTAAAADSVATQSEPNANSL